MRMADTALTYGCPSHMETIVMKLSFMAVLLAGLAVGARAQPLTYLRTPLVDNPLAQHCRFGNWQLVTCLGEQLV